MQGKSQRFGVAAAMAAALMLSACQSRTASLNADPMATASTNNNTGPSLKKFDGLAKAWKADPANVQAALAYGANLEELGQKETQLDVLHTSAEQTQNDAVAQSTLGKAMLQAGDLPGATASLRRAATLNPNDAHALNALGAVLDQQTLHAEAREKYQAALALSPKDVSIMNNLAMSFALQGKLPDAEATLRKALALPGAKSQPRIRQNLALVIGLQGRFDEAKQVASQDLPPDQVQENMAYLQQMLQKPNTWSQLKEG